MPKRREEEIKIEIKEEEKEKNPNMISKSGNVNFTEA